LKRGINIQIYNPSMGVIHCKNELLLSALFFSPELQQLTWLTIDSVYGMTLIIIEPLVTASYWQTQSTWSKTTIATRPSSVLLFTIWSHTRFNVVHCCTTTDTGAVAVLLKYVDYVHHTTQACACA